METLPLLEYTGSLFDKIRFDEIVLIASQHILPTNLALFRYLFNRGLSPENTYLIGKSYSTDPPVESAFRDIGAKVFGYPYNSHVSFDEQFTSALHIFLGEALKNLPANKKVIVLDDGGALISIINANSHPNISCVEQTASGYNLLRQGVLNYPVINVAYSWAKLNFESPFISAANIDQTQLYLKKQGIHPQRALVIGGGSIGINVFQGLSQLYETSVFDVLPGRSAFPNKSLENLLSNFDLIIGCTGTPLISREHHVYIRSGTVLVSASSSDREFNAVDFRRRVNKTDDCHKDIIVDGIHLPNSGFPLNFRGYELEDPAHIQLTRSLVLAGLCLANEGNYRNGFVEIPFDVQEGIIGQYEKLAPSKHL